MRRPLPSLPALAAAFTPHVRIAASLSLAAALHAIPAAAQDGPDGLRYAVPAGYQRVAAYSDTLATIYHNPQGGSWLMVGTLPGADQRPARVSRLLLRIGKVALGREPADWQLMPGSAPDPSTPFYQHLEVEAGERSLSVMLQQVRVGGRDALVGSAFVSVPDPRQFCVSRTNGLAAGARERLIASLQGRPLPAELGFAGRGFQELSPGQGDPPPEVRPGPALPPNPEAARVLAAYDAYFGALRERRADLAAQRVTPAVLGLYADLRVLALYATPAQVRALPLVERMLVLGFRHRLDATQLLAMSPAQVLAYAAETDARMVAGVTPDAPVVTDGTATIRLLDQGRPTPARIEAVQLGDAWKLDLLPLAAVVGCQIRAGLRQNGIGRDREDEVLLRGLRDSTGRLPSPDIWQPLVERQGLSTTSSRPGDARTREGGPRLARR